MSSPAENLTELINRVKAKYIEAVADIPYPTNIVRDIRNLAYQKEYPIDDNFVALVKSACDSDMDSNDLTGVCIPIARLLSFYMEKVHGVEAKEYEIMFYYQDADDVENMVYRLVKLDDKYYDLFFPEGIADISKHPLWQEYDDSDEVFFVAPISNCYSDIFQLSETVPIYKLLRDFVPVGIDPSPICILLC